MFASIIVDKHSNNIHQMIKNLKSLRLYAMAVVALGISIQSVFAADPAVKREMRSAWVATVWRLDWPQTVISSTGNASQISAQKKQMTTMLDSLQLNNMNAVCFQVRSRCDAFYKSSYEPWSSDLVSTRGMDPGYDPLAFCIEECHKRGMECHAWLNPYRYESAVGQWNGTPKAYRTDHPDWLLDIGEASILNPALPEVRQRICDIIDEIVRNYDVDGVLFDDYFYIQGVSSEDAAQYQEYKDGGGTLSLGDWRRDNVNQMVAQVYKTIKDAKPYVRFGISPAGVAATSSSVAAKYGVERCPVSSDWQYNGIYSDPLAWVSSRNLDFISPQIYWKIGSSADYDALCKWWSNIANKWGRHFFSSQAPYNNFGEEEYADEVRLNREYTLNDAPGSIFYSVKYLYRTTTPKLAHYLKNQVFNTPALAPAMTWFPVSSPAKVSNVKRSGSTLTWTGVEGMRYTVYAVPNSVAEANFDREPEYLLGVSYGTSYTIPSDKITGYRCAVCVYDRYGNEYSPVFVGAAVTTLPAPELKSPADNANVELPFIFSWNAVSGAANYILEVGEDASMNKLVGVAQVSATECMSTAIDGLTNGKKLYWRVRSCAANANDGVSASRSFTPTALFVTSLNDGDQNVSLTPTITWSVPERSVQLQIAKSADFGDNDIVLDVAANNGYVVPKYLLKGLTSYSLRLKYKVGEYDVITTPITFTTKAVDPVTPKVIASADGILYADSHLAIEPIEGVSRIRLEMSANEKFTSSRSSYINTTIAAPSFTDTKEARDIKVEGKNLVDGTKYYVRARATFATADADVNSEWSAVETFTYKDMNGVNDIEADTNDSAILWDGKTLKVNDTQAVITIYNIGGASVASYDKGISEVTPTLPAGVYIVTDGCGHRLKIVIK